MPPGTLQAQTPAHSIEKLSKAFGADESYQILHGRVHDVLRGKVVRQDCFCCGAIFVREGMLVFIEHGKFAELKENVVQHVGLLPGDAFRDMEPVPGKPLEGKVLCAPPGFGMDAPDPCKISDDERINAVILIKGVKIPCWRLDLAVQHLCKQSRYGGAGCMLSKQ